jgi:hypothetical protein
MCSWSVLQENNNNKCSRMDFLPSFLPWMLKAELSLTLLYKTAAASCCCCGHCRPWLNLLLLNNKTIPFPSLTRPDRSSHKWVPWQSSHSVCGVRGCCWNKSASFCIRIFGIHCLHLSLSLCVALWRKLKLKLKLSHSHQSQPRKKLTVLSSSSSSMRTHSLQNRTVLNYESLRHHSFIHSLLDFPWSSTAFQLPTKCPTKSQKRRGRRRRRRRRRRKSHTHTHKHTQRTRGGDHGSTDNQQRGNQSD